MLLYISLVITNYKVAMCAYLKIFQTVGHIHYKNEWFNLLSAEMNFHLRVFHQGRI